MKKKSKRKVKDGDMWRMAAQRLARAIIRFQSNYNANLSDSTIIFAYKVKKGNI